MERATHRISEKWSRLLADLSQDPTGPRMRWGLWLVLPLILLAGSTLLIRLTGFDFSFQKALYMAGGNSWSIGEHPFWKALYHYGTAIPAITVLSSFVGLVMGFYREKFRRWRKIFLFSILLAVLGPGVITNGILKEYWGRPRPRHVEDLGGHQKFEPILTLDLSSKGKSFPCGHATMGFYFFGGFFLLRRYRRGIAEGFLAFGITWGTLIGMARMAQGGHFLSDVIWAAAVCYFTAMGLYFAFRLDERLVLPASREKKMSRTAKIGSSIAGLAVLGGILVATPYRDERDIQLLHDYAKEGPLRIHLTLVVGESDLLPAEEFSISGEAYGHGVPTSQIAFNYLEYDLEDLTYVIFQERKSGWFTEVNEQLEVNVPWSRTRELWLQTSSSVTRVSLPVEATNTVIRIMRGDGEIHLESQGHDLEFVDSLEEGEKRNFSLLIDEDFEGRLLIDEKPVIPAEIEKKRKNNAIDGPAP